jgi:MFS family permease
VAAQAVIGGGAGPETGRSSVPDPGHRAAGPSVRTSLVPLVVTGTLASAAATALPSFTATAGLAQGLSPFGVAAAQIAGSLGSVVVRIAAPVAVRTASRRARHAVVAGLVATGSLGLLLLLAGTAATFVAGAVLGFAFGWGWNGLYNQLVATSSPDRVATATGVTQTGVFLGGTAGPVLFAVIVDRTGFTAAWLTMAVLMAVAAVSALTGRPSPTTPVAAGVPGPRPVPERS